MIKGKRLTDKEFQNFILDEIDRARELPKDFDEIIKPFLLSNDKCVSTIPDECKGVGLEISTSSQAGGHQKMEHIVNADGNIG